MPEGISLGSTAVTYELGPVNLGSYYDSGAKIDGQILTLPIKAVESDSETKIGTITVTIHTQNFEDMTATIDVRSVNKQSVDISGVTLTGRTYNGSPIEYQQTATASVDGKTVHLSTKIGHKFFNFLQLFPFFRQFIFLIYSSLFGLAVPIRFFIIVKPACALLSQLWA